jgi:hypothetical protein
VVFSPSCTVVSCGVVWIIFSVGEFYTFDVLLVVLVMVGLYHLWVFMLLFLVSDFLSRLSFLLGGGLVWIHFSRRIVTSYQGGVKRELFLDHVSDFAYTFFFFVSQVYGYIRHG